MPAFGDLFTDVRGGDRTMRVSYHEDRGVVVVSLWAGTLCRGSFRLAAGEVSELIALLSQIELSSGGSAAAVEADPVPDTAPDLNPDTATRSIMPIPRVA